VAEGGITITRVFDASRTRVWEEWTRPGSFSDWFGGPDAHVPLDTVEMDVRVGGAWRLTMFAQPGPREINWHGEYLEVEEPQRLVFSLSDQAPGERYEIVIVDLTELADGRTEMHFEQRGELPPEVYEAAKQGWGAFFDRFAVRLRT
jgi:uncharacterized protein YndB with AHSA1/START domain